MANLTSPYQGPDSAVRSAVAQVVESGQQLLSDRLDLAQLEFKLGVESYAERAAAFVAAGVMMAVGFVVLTYGLVQLLDQYMPAGTSGVTVGGAYLAIGGGLFWAAATRHGNKGIKP